MRAGKRDRHGSNRGSNDAAGRHRNQRLKQPLWSWSALGIVVCVTFAFSASAEDRRVAAVADVGVTVADMERSLEFYTRVLPFEIVSDIELAGEDVEHWLGVFAARVRIVRLKLGEESLTLTDFLAPEGSAYPVDSRSNDLWFQHIAIITSDMQRAYVHLRQHHVQHVSPGPQRLPDWNPKVAGIEAFYFKDPDGHALEILAFPPDKGPAKWHRNTKDLFLGIDHTAIVVQDTEASLTFYRDRLGMQVVGGSDNSGIEQERLNGVFGARLRITTLHAQRGPGIEFLEYLAPADGRPRPVGVRANDLVHWQTTLMIADVDAAASVLQEASAPLLSSGVVTLDGNKLDFAKALLVQDPDGHVLQIVEPHTASTQSRRVKSE